ncbi:MAG: hypothetical protein M1828_005556 [Chrysothrix sp. TS-e1954]|nr:MAG: hypothetical protein M1828_005556 [Chrysothrix sp. TS-e1954]
MSNLEPSAPAQPELNQVYTTPGNPAQTEPAEDSLAHSQATANTTTTDKRVPTKQTSSIDEATPSSLGYGVHGAGPGEEARGGTHESVGRSNELDGNTQMRAPGEGDVRDVVMEKPGATGGQSDMASDLDRKKAEQAPMREEIKEQRRENVDVGGVLSNRGGPADPVDKGNYPNS